MVACLAKIVIVPKQALTETTSTQNSIDLSLSSIVSPLIQARTRAVQPRSQVQLRVAFARWILWRSCRRLSLSSMISRSVWILQLQIIWSDRSWSRTTMLRTSIAITNRCVKERRWVDQWDIMKVRLLWGAKGLVMHRFTMWKASARRRETGTRA